MDGGDGWQSFVLYGRTLLVRQDGELLHWFYDEGFVPGAHVVIREAQPAAGQFKVLLSGNESAIGEKAAAGLYVRPS